MNREVAKKWVKALRSKKYSQGQYYLKQYNKQKKPKYCCLGVLCELYNLEMKRKHKRTLIQKEKDHCDEAKCGYVTYNRISGCLPKAVQKWAGIKSAYGDFGERDIFCMQKSLSFLNDSGSRFSTIANVIEKNVEQL